MAETHRVVHHPLDRVIPMPHQEALTVLAEVSEGRLASLRKLLGRIPDHVERWDVLPFEKLSGLHFARLVLFDPTRDLDGHPVPAQVALMTDVDAPLRAHLDELATIGGDGIDAVFSHCVGYPGTASMSERRAFLLAHQVKAAAAHINRRGRSVSQIRQEDRLQREINTFLDGGDLGSLDPGKIKSAIVDFVRDREDLTWALEPAEGPSLLWRAKEALHKYFWIVALAVVTVAFLPLVVLGLGLFALVLRYHEKHDQPDTRAAAPDAVRAYRDDEDYWAHNQIVAVGFLKPGSFRRLTTTAILFLTDYATRHIYNRGTLSGLNTIHFARWVRMNGNRGLFFSSNYDGSLESYMNDFIDKAFWGLNAIFSNGDGFPRTRFLFFGGITDEKAYKKLLPTRQAPSNVWYSAYPHLTTKNIANNEAIRHGLSTKMDDAQTRRWLRRFGCGNDLPESNWAARKLDSIPWDRLWLSN
ncbi:hypothetical protein [Mycolicibacterium neworleansense]|uniref:hypothetical protein n=1 Tax=Mycolicibacterium neworleansense TaxID=146018 RepID=UPI0013313A00|nr:hypothetical protein [Mycolicibacterium neworleansense]MCV7362893.1 hypothetical protein [Mycolicibacterium neworleansense]